MPRRSPSSRLADQRIYEALVLGHSPAEVAARFQMQIEQVLAAERRVLDERGALTPEEAAVEEQLTSLRVLYRLSLDTFQKCAPDLRDPRLLRIALAALSRQQALILKEDDPESTGVDSQHSRSLAT